MKKIISPASKEECIYYSDFDGKILESPPITMKIEFDYGSVLDGSDIELHLTDEEPREVLNLLKNKLSSYSYKHNQEFWDKLT